MQWEEERGRAAKDSGCRLLNRRLPFLHDSHPDIGWQTETSFP